VVCSGLRHRLLSFTIASQSVLKAVLGLINNDPGARTIPLNRVTIALGTMPVRCIKHGYYRPSDIRRPLHIAAVPVSVGYLQELIPGFGCDPRAEPVINWNILSFSFLLALPW
jgi:hypothetical protein